MLDDGRITIGLIVNGIHVCPALVRQVWRLTAGRLNLVRDAMAALGMPDGLYQLGDFALTGGNGRARLADGTLAGSILPLDQAVRHLMAYAACDFAATVDAAMVRRLAAAMRLFLLFLDSWI
ncbi:MAG: hypothetical protein H6650_12365 [Ardenticatenales bacterium]|nr:hypothetical protein [Ardenticatenales bacterium]